MAQLRQRDMNAPPPIRPLSDFLPRSKEPSMLYSMLPAVVQSRLPRIPSLRCSFSMYEDARKRKPISSSRPSSGASTASTKSGMRTPEAGYTSAIVLSDLRAGSLEDDMAGYFERVLSDEEAPTLKARQTQGPELTESKSGIEWKFANQGISLLSLAVNESSSIAKDPSFGNASFARQLYLHAITYLIHALPSDLTTEEQITIRSSLPHGIVEPLHLEVKRYTSRTPCTSSESQPSILHRTLAFSIIQLFIFVQLVLPYIKHLLSAAYQYDREHKILAKVLSHGIETVDSLGKTGLILTGALCGMGDGRLGQAITETAAWLVEGITGGIHEGLGEGMVIMGVPRKSAGPERK